MSSLQPKQQGGVALITVLLVVALITTLAVEINGQLQRTLHRAGNQAQAQQGDWYALSGESFARRVLEQELAESDTVHLEQNWARSDLVFPIEGGTLAGEIRDLRACFNLNALAHGSDSDGLVDPTQLRREERQFEALLDALETRETDRRRLRETLVDWIDPDLQPRGYGGAEDLVYSALQPPYAPPNGPLGALSELYLLAETEHRYAEELTPFVCALPKPGPWRLNINTVTAPELLMAFFTPLLSREQAEELLTSRPGQGWESVDQFWSEPLIETINPPQELKPFLQVQSTYFQVSVRVSYYQTQRLLVTALQLNNNRAVPYSRQYGGSL